MLPPPPRCDRRVASVLVRQLRAFLALLIVLSPQAALACGAFVSDSGRVELTGIEGLVRWDGTTESLLVSVSFQTDDAKVGWLMPLPAAPEIEESDRTLIDEAIAITTPPQQPGSDEGEGAGAPQVGGAPGVDVIGRETIGGLRFVTLTGGSAGDVGVWMRRHAFGFHDRQELVLQSYLDRDWVVVAARVAPGKAPVPSLLPVRFTFDSPELVYPLAMAGSSHSDIYLAMTLFVLTPFRPASTTYPESIVEPRPNLAPPLPGDDLELRYTAPLGGNAQRMEATPGTWLTRYEGLFPVDTLTEDLVLERAGEQDPVVFASADDEDGILVWVTRIGVVIVAAVLAIWITLGMARRRRSSEAARLPTPGPGV